MYGTVWYQLFTSLPIRTLACFVNDREQHESALIWESCIRIRIAY
jgi:hypothetical protein